MTTEWGASFGAVSGGGGGGSGGFVLVVASSISGAGSLSAVGGAGGFASGGGGVGGSGYILFQAANLAAPPATNPAFVEVTDCTKGVIVIPPADERLDHFKCYDADGDPVDATVDLADQFGVEPGVLVGKPQVFCNPVDKNGEGILDPEAHLTCYEIEDLGERQAVLISNQFGEQTLTVNEPQLLCVPSEKLDVQPLPPDCSDFPCGKKGEKVSLCHVPPGNPGNLHTICISPNAVPAHLANHEGDFCGPCP